MKEELENRNEGKIEIQKNLEQVTGGARGPVTCKKCGKTAAYMLASGKYHCSNCGSSFY